MDATTHIWREANHVRGGDQVRDPGGNVRHAADRPYHDLDHDPDRGLAPLARFGREGGLGDNPGGYPGNGWEDQRGGPGE